MSSDESVRAYTEIIRELYPDAQLLGHERLTGGVSADVHRLDLRKLDGELASVVLRAHRADHSGHPAELEYDLLQALHRGGIPVAEPLLVDVSGERLATPLLVIRFIEGTTQITEAKQGQRIEAMAAQLGEIHGFQSHVSELPDLPLRCDPLPEVFEFIPEGETWTALREYLGTLSDTAYTGSPKLLHGDFWAENILWRGDDIVGVLDWEDAALGDPLSDLAAASVELRYKFGVNGMRAFVAAYAQHNAVEPRRLALWQIYVASAAHRYMGDWGLAPELEAHMREQALASMDEACTTLGVTR